MTNKCLLLLFCIVACNCSAFAGFNFNNNCVEAYKDILALRINEAKLSIQKEKKLNPQNGIALLLENYADYFSLYASDNKADFEKLKPLKFERISALEKNDENSPYYLFCQAEIYLQWGLLKAKFGDYVSSAMDLRKANLLLKDNQESYPQFLPNQKSLALINVIFGSTPANIKNIAQFVGIRGNVQEGIKQLEQFRNAIPKSRYSFYLDEVAYFFCYIDIDILHNRKAYSKLISYLAGMESRSLLKTYLQGYVAVKTAHNDDAIAFLQNAPVSNQYAELPAIYYLLGNAKLNRMDSDTPVYLIKYIKTYKGQNYIKDSYLKLAFYSLLQDDMDKYDYYLKLLRTEGASVNEKDKQALKESNEPKPNIDILKARFYFDGGYYNKAYTQLKDKDPSRFKLLRDKIEYQYRLARIFEETQKMEEALIYYQKTILLGKNSGYYYAANSALKMASIFEQKKEYTKAVNFYHQAINMKSHEYENSIENEAKVGLKRMGK